MGEGKFTSWNLVWVFVCGVEFIPSRALFCNPVLSAVAQLGGLLSWDGFGEERQEGGISYFYLTDNV